MKADALAKVCKSSQPHGLGDGTSDGTRPAASTEVNGIMPPVRYSKTSFCASNRGKTMALTSSQLPRTLLPGLTWGALQTQAT